MLGVSIATYVLEVPLHHFVRGADGASVEFLMEGQGSPAAFKSFLN